MNTELDTFTQNYLLTALWASYDADGEPLDATYTIEDFSPVAIQEAIKACTDFQTTAKLLLEQAYTLYTPNNDALTPQCQAGHDFWLTRCGEGVGFWDRRGLGKVGDDLTALCGNGTAWPPLHVYVGDDKKLHFE